MQHFSSETKGLIYEILKMITNTQQSTNVLCCKLFVIFIHLD